MADAMPGVIQFEGYRLIDAKFSCDSGFEFHELKNGEFRYSFSKCHTAISENEMQVNLRSRVFYSDNDDFDTAPYRVSIEIAGRFSSKTAFKKMWENNALAILFPYVRSIVSCITAQSGRNAVILPTVNIARMFEESEEDKSKLDR